MAAGWSAASKVPGSSTTIRQLRTFNLKACIIGNDPRGKLWMMVFGMAVARKLSSCGTVSRTHTHSFVESYPPALLRVNAFYEFPQGQNLWDPNLLRLPTFADSNCARYQSVCFEASDSVAR